MQLKKLLILLFFFAIATEARAGNNVDVNQDPLLKTFITNPRQLPDARYQQQLEQLPAWQNFITHNGQWTVFFNEENQKPHNAVGQPVQMNVFDSPFSVANDFISQQLSAFNVPVNQLVYRNTATNKKYHYLNYKQFYNGLEVLWAKAFVKMTLDNRVMQFGLDVFDNISISTTPSVGSVAAVAAASQGVSGITSVSTPQLKILPVPAFHQNIFHLVYEITVRRTDNENIPGEYYTLVDANTGKVLYRQNNVNFIANTDVNVTATVYPTQPYNPTSTEPLRNLQINVNSTNYNTDSTGYLGLTNSSSVTATLKLQGLWATIKTGATIPTFTSTFNPGANSISFDTHANIKELSAYQSVQEIHDYYKSVATSPSLNTVKDFSIVTNIDVAGTCNAFYNGELNFYDVGGGCNPTSEIDDVVYHEYGHGINSDVYNHYGGNFGNGALGEGYADTWANGLTQNAVLGYGFFTGNPTGYVRRYDINKKIYPQDLVGEVHADGEIIAGCWWDTYLNLGSMQDREELYLETFAATLTAASGQEGTLYHDVLIEALTDDDTDGNLANGTPHFCQITSAFAIHGIYYGSVGALNNTTSLAATKQTPITLSGTITGLTTGAVNAYYRLNNSTGPWTTAALANTSGSNYSTTIPGLPGGNIVHYYMDVTDQCGTHINIIPARATAADPNIPYNVLVGFSQFSIDDFDNFQGTWITGIPSDNATTGLWTIDIPIASYLTPATQTGLVQPGFQNTPGGQVCALTANANPSDPAGTQDVDNGTTTLLSPVFNLQGHLNPAFSYYRWFSNDQGANPGKDPWQVLVTNDLNTYIPVENSHTADHSWRRYAFRVADYVTPSSTVQVKFIAEDIPDPLLNPQGSLVEALVDDLVLWDEIPEGINETENFVSMAVYPNPAKDIITIKWNQLKGCDVNISLLDELGREVYNNILSNVNPGFTKYQVNTAKLDQGVYYIRMTTDKSTRIEKVTIAR